MLRFGEISGMLGRLQSHLETPISIQSLVVIRVAFGLILAWDCWRYIDNTRIYRYYVEPDMLFPFLPFVQPLPEPWIHILWGGVGLFGITVALGLFYRFSIVALTMIFAYFFLLDRAQYLNHNYMVILYGTLLCFTPAGRAFSLDAILFPRIQTLVIPRWPVSAIKLQTEIILIYAGWVKIADDWLRGEPLKTWLQNDTDKIFYGFLFQYDIAFVVAAWGTIILHILGAPLLLWRRTRLAVFLIYAFFHWSNAQLFNIGIFPWITIAITTIFFAPDWPQRLLFRMFGRFGNICGSQPKPAAKFRLNSTLSAVLAIWFAVQVYLPERQLIFNNNVAWTGDGHRFSWRMRIYTRDREGYFRIVSEDGTENWEAYPTDLMEWRQARNVLARPDLVWMFAGRLKEIWADQGYDNVRVYAEIRVSLNGRPMQPFIDPTVDLAAVPWEHFSETDWILPLQGRVSETWLPVFYPPEFMRR